MKISSRLGFRCRSTKKRVWFLSAETDVHARAIAESISFHADIWVSKTKRSNTIAYRPNKMCLDILKKFKKIDDTLCHGY